MDKVVGIDLAAWLAAADALEVDRRILTILVPSIERGIVAGLQQANSNG